VIFGFCEFDWQGACLSRCRMLKCTAGPVALLLTLLFVQSGNATPVEVVPDGGASVGLLGLGIIGLALFQRKAR